MAAHKNECPVAAGQVVKSISKYASDFIATAERLTNTASIFSLIIAALLLQSFLMRLGVLQ
jgi:hypothetical protein